ncbi:hypothetical protein RJ639_040919 [Escallonia herrerae]|uniref:RRM Nup35-type domain-containing protein n=1 Tax=Escallonia herrerae TaxID=1293975 RepID=A0AA88WG79_9ASTE|nr:hypothetical protein RJ639_040919 [Escallonia herrerae]
MSTSTVHRTPKSGRQSLFFHDLTSPVSTRRSGGGSSSKFTTPGQAAAVSALWRENFATTDLPPPPVFTLEDRHEFSPEMAPPDYFASPEVKSFSNPRTPLQMNGASRDYSTPTGKLEAASTSYGIMGRQQQQSPAGGFSWWSPGKSGGGGSGDVEDKGKGSPVDGVVQAGALVTVPPPREVARPEMQRSSLPVGDLDEEEWVTVYGIELFSEWDFGGSELSKVDKMRLQVGQEIEMKEVARGKVWLKFLRRFSPGDTNLVLREFEKCGIILKHVPGPRDANWMHILYQNRFDAHKALSKNGMQINGVLIVGVKPVDPMQRQALNERINGFMPLPPGPSGRSSEPNGFRASPRPYYLQNGSSNSRQSAGTIATPAKSVVSKVMDLMFGV